MTQCVRELGQHTYLFRVHDSVENNLPVQAEAEKKGLNSVCFVWLERKN